MKSTKLWFSFNFRSILRLILSWIIIFAVIFLGSKVVPSKIMMESWQDAAIVAAVMDLLGTVVAFVFYLIVIKSLLLIKSRSLVGFLFILSIVFLLVVLNPLALYWSTKICTGVVIKGFWTYFLLGMVILILDGQISTKDD